MGSNDSRAKALVAAAVAWGFQAAAPSARAATPLAANGQLKVCGTTLCNESGYPIQLRGVSMHGVQWFHSNFYKDGKALAAMADWGADVTRIPVYSDTILPPECDKFSADGYLGSRFLREFPDSRTGFKVLVDRYVAQAESLGMYALIDWHLHFPGNPNKLLEPATEFFDYMSRKHGHRKNVLYEIVNEPSRHSGTCPDARKPAPDCFWNDCIKPYAEKIISVIRKNDPDGVIVVGTTCWSSFGLKCVNNPAGDFYGQDGPRYPGEFEATRANRLSDPNVMYTVHIYSGDGKWKADRIDEMAAHLPLFLTEWAAQNSAAFADSNKADNAWPEARRIIDISVKRKISWAYWNLSPGKYMAVYKPNTRSTANLGPKGGNTTVEGDSVHAWMNFPADDFRGPSRARPQGLVAGPGLRWEPTGRLVLSGIGDPPAWVSVHALDGRHVASAARRFPDGREGTAYDLGALTRGEYLLRFRIGKGHQTRRLQLD